MEKRAEIPTLYITGQGRIGIETARKFGDIVGAVTPGTLGGLDLSDGKADLARVFGERLGTSGSRDEAVMVHTFSYDRDNAQAIADQITSAKKQFPEVFHFGLVLKPADPLSSRYFRQTEQHPIEGLGIPLTVLDEGKAVQIQEQRVRTRLKPEDIALYAVAGLYKGHSTFPELNPHTPREVLEALTDTTNLIGVAVGGNEHYLHLRRLPYFDIPIPFLPRFLAEHQLRDGINSAIRDTLFESGNLIPFERQEDATVNVLAVQLPLHPKHPHWRDRSYWKSFKDFAVQVGGLHLKENSLVALFNPVMTPVFEGEHVSSTAALFYPTKPN